MIEEKLIYSIMILVLAYIITIFGGSIAIRHFLKLFDLSESSSSEKKGLPKAGRIVGMLERGIVLSLALFGNYSSVSFIFIAKSMARFSQLQDRRFAEYYLVGTLASFFIALIMAIITQVAIFQLQLPQLFEK